MRILIIISTYFLATTLAFSQKHIIIFKGSIDSALIQAKIQNKNIFFITRSESCPVFGKFRIKIEQDKSTFDFLNSEFIVFEYDMDNATKNEHKRLKKYYHSWRSFPQLYFLSMNEKIITELDYSLTVSHETQLAIWKKYKSVGEDWRAIKKQTRKKQFSYDQLLKYITYRSIIYSPFELIQINKKVSKYFRGVNPDDYSLQKHWILFKESINLNGLGSNHKLVDFVARNKEVFQKENGVKEVSDYLFENYYSNIIWRKEKKINKIAEKYPYNTVEEAKEAVRIYKRNKQIQNLFK